MMPSQRRVATKPVIIQCFTSIATNDLVDLVEHYRKRKYAEEVEAINKYGGNFNRVTFWTGLEGVRQKLVTDYVHGLTPVDFEERERHFGSNYRAPPKRTPFCKLFLGALDDFMLKLLLVCACVSISIEVGFAEPNERSHGNIHCLMP